MKDAEDEAFEQLALKQGQWEHTSGWRKKQIMDTQAFPNPHRTDISGMTLRDYFAAKAMQAHLSMPETHTAIATNKTTFQNVCGGCYAWADAMLKAREA
jgi:hypothetical protein